MNGQNTLVMAAKEEAVKLLLNPNRNIVGVGIGKKMKNGKETREDCVRVYVVSKINPNDLSPKSLVPQYFLGVPTDVIDVGRFGWKGIRPKRRKKREEEKVADPTPRPGSPIRVKTNAPNVNEGFRGTLGAVVTNGTDQYILSCNHILAVNGRVPKDAEIVSAEFVGKEDAIAKPGYSIKLERDGGNSVDCAVALLPKSVRKVQATFPDGFTLSPDRPADPLPDMKVTKFGAVTERTGGKIVDIYADLYVDYSFGTFLFRNQVMIDGGSDETEFATSGDSGSLVADTDTNRATAMIFAASGRFAVACPLEMVLKKLKAEMKVPKLYVVV